ncbi:ABC transporter ATP-binding protein [Geomesophilobacter sediminis]|uniref:ABC transporter ATP-binding protein n=1 Tax=Geomesophilobacter sediminis TaxID=2798584 RepID=A0A8J7S9W0_9BACT|nr:ABC transporter ATP-binding protein [Geomesophilobacter sediminis]MBJ6727086.1 ABC transporter ATP-binding protein [Geomesophilobacter sediminis]
MNLAIRAENLSKRFCLSGLYRQDTLRDQIASGLQRLLHPANFPRATKKDFWALRDVSFEIPQGEVIGIIGQNGAGKSTLLKILSQIVEPTMGRAEIYGRVGSLLEVGTGFHPELTGRENIYLNGAIIGMPKQEINRLFDAIVDFAEISKFVDMPVKRYSSGMYVRLAFAVSAHLRPEILMIDEVLSVGDLQFQRKCMRYAETLRKSNSTILFVSHNMFAVKTMCNRVLVLSGGRIIFDGEPADAIKVYEGETAVSELSWARDAIGGDPSEWAIYITNIEIMDESGQQKNLFNHGERMRVRLTFDVRNKVDNANFLVSFIRSDEISCCNYNTTMDGFHLPVLQTNNALELLTPPLKLVSDSYKIYVLVRDSSFERLYCAHVGKSFHVKHELLDAHFGVYHEPGEWFMRTTGSSKSATGTTGG